LASRPILGRPLERGLSVDKPSRPGHTLAFARPLV